MTTYTDEMKQDWQLKVARHPDAVVRDLAERFPPWELFRMLDTEQVVSVVESNEEGTMRVYVEPEHTKNRISGHEVFGITADKLWPYTVLS